MVLCSWPSPRLASHDDFIISWRDNKLIIIEVPFDISSSSQSCCCVRFWFMFQFKVRELQWRSQQEETEMRDEWRDQEREFLSPPRLHLKWAIKKSRRHSLPMNLKSHKQSVMDSLTRSLSFETKFANLPLHKPCFRTHKLEFGGDEMRPSCMS